jgi:hypothetical protein
VVTLVLAVVLAQPAPLRVTVIDISDSDAIYEDISRGLAEDVTRALAAAGFDATRIDESELPQFPCPPGPCLARVAKDTRAQMLVTLDARELDKVKVGVGLTALLGRDGTPLAGARYTLTQQQKKVPRELTAFAADLFARANKLLRPAPADAGVRDAGHPAPSPR